MKSITKRHYEILAEYGPHGLNDEELYEDHQLEHDLPLIYEVQQKSGLLELVQYPSQTSEALDADQGAIWSIAYQQVLERRVLGQRRTAKRPHVFNQVLAGSGNRLTSRSFLPIAVTTDAR